MKKKEYKLKLNGRKPAWCYEHQDFAWIYSDGSFGCWYCDIVEKSCDCKEVKRIKILPIIK